VSKMVRSPEFSGDSMVPAEVSLCPFTVMAKGIVHSVPPRATDLLLMGPSAVGSCAARAQHGRKRHGICS
jgi:hypothetical protein